MFSGIAGAARLANGEIVVGDAGDRVQADVRGNLWVRTFDNFGTAAASWAVVTAQGTPVGLVAAPRFLNITEVGADYVLGFSEDADGVERVELYRIPRFPPAPPSG
jgi:hypothetical protein